ncbi:MAG TPA: FadR/GntR family transcriptional regulator [Pseudonocardia sp.]|nr:FadR/GntR family transcriptional regulator [Pseudonocardia sp.]
MTAHPTTRSPVSKLQPAKMSEVVARALLDHIVEADLQPGDPLPNERDAIAWLGVSRGSLREGLRLLEAQGVISVRPGPGGGPVVREADPEVFASTTTLLMQFMRVPFGEVLDTRIAFEPQVAEEAARHRTDLQADGLEVRAEQMRAAVSDTEEYQSAYDRFHRLLAESTHNRVLLLSGLTFRKIWDPIHAEVDYGLDALQRTAASHRRLALAVRDRDPEAARAASRRHLTAYRTYLIAHQPDLLDRRVEWATNSQGGRA